MFPVNLSQTLLTLALVHIAQPIVRLDIGKGTCRTKTVNQQLQTVVVVSLMNPVQLHVGIRNLLHPLLTLLTTRNGKQCGNSEGNG